MNLSIYDNSLTAKTCEEVAKQRAETLNLLNVSTVIELCVGPSLRIIENAYKEKGIYVWGNDIDRRWRDYYRQGKWIIEDCFNIDYKQWDAVVFAPPLSKGCSGKREDSLKIEDVSPSYYEFLKKDFNIAVLVLPARSLSTTFDKEQFYKLLNACRTKSENVLVYIRTAGRRNIRKYVEIIIEK